MAAQRMARLAVVMMSIRSESDSSGEYSRIGAATHSTSRASLSAIALRHAVQRLDFFGQDLTHLRQLVVGQALQRLQRQRADLAVRFLATAPAEAGRSCGPVRRAHRRPRLSASKRLVCAWRTDWPPRRGAPPPCPRLAMKASTSGSASARCANSSRSSWPRSSRRRSTSSRLSWPFGGFVLPLSRAAVIRSSRPIGPADAAFKCPAIRIKAGIKGIGERDTAESRAMSGQPCVNARLRGGRPSRIFRPCPHATKPIGRIPISAMSERWVFDLDHTLYTIDAARHAAMSERICLYVQRHLGLERDPAWDLQKTLSEGVWQHAGRADAPSRRRSGRLS